MVLKGDSPSNINEREGEKGGRKPRRGGVGFGSHFLPITFPFRKTILKYFS